MKQALIIGGLLLAGLLAWVFIIDAGDEPVEFENSEPEDFPARAEESQTASELATFESENSSLNFEYRENWAVTPGAGNTSDTELFTVESPLDYNEFYFCLDLYKVGADSDESFVISNTEVLDVDHLEDESLHSVIYSVEGIDGLQWGVSGEEAEGEADSFTSEITSQAGDRLQVLGRFNCREEAKPELSVEEFQNARWFQEAHAIINSLEF